jgi:hypothetical protein
MGVSSKDIVHVRDKGCCDYGRRARKQHAKMERDLRDMGNSWDNAAKMPCTRDGCGRGLSRRQRHKAHLPICLFTEPATARKLDKPTFLGRVAHEFAARPKRCRSGEGSEPNQSEIRMRAGQEQTKDRPRNNHTKTKRNPSNHEPTPTQGMSKRESKTQTHKQSN